MLKIMGENNKLFGWTIKHGDYKSTSSPDEKVAYNEKKKKITTPILWGMGILITCTMFYGILELINKISR
jgi:hypothetical protein